MQMYWTEPLEWNRVKAVAKEVSRAYHWKMMCAVSIALFLVPSLVVRWCMPLTAEFLTYPRILLGVLVVTVFALVPFLQSFQSGSVIFRRKWLDVSDSFVHVFLPYETIEWIRFERYQGKTYFAVKGLSRRSQNVFEVRVALTAKYSESDITAYLVQRGLGGRLQEMPRFCRFGQSPRKIRMKRNRQFCLRVAFWGRWGCWWLWLLRV